MAGMFDTSGLDTYEVDESIVDNFISLLNDNNIKVSGEIKELYKALPKHIKQKAKLILLPVATAEEVVYAMDAKTGEPIPFDFKRASQASFLDQKDGKLQFALANVPRIDKAYYAEEPKLMMEKSATNLVPKLEAFTLGGFKKIVDQHGEECLFSGNNYYNTAESAQIIPTIEDENYTLSGYTNLIERPNFFVLQLFCKDKVNAGLLDILFEGFDSVTTRASLTKRNNSLRIMGRDGNSRSCSCKRFQYELGDFATSFMDYGTSRSADLLTYTLKLNSRVLINTVNNGELIFNKKVGIWNIHDDIPTSDGIRYLVIF